MRVRDLPDPHAADVLDPLAAGAEVLAFDLYLRCRSHFTEARMSQDLYTCPACQGVMAQIDFSVTPLVIASDPDSTADKAFLGLGGQDEEAEGLFCCSKTCAVSWLRSRELVRPSRSWWIVLHDQDGRLCRQKPLTIADP